MSAGEYISGNKLMNVAPSWRNPILDPAILDRIRVYSTWINYSLINISSEKYVYTLYTSANKILGFVKAIPNKDDVSGYNVYYWFDDQNLMVDMKQFLMTLKLKKHEPY